METMSNLQLELLRRHGNGVSDESVCEIKTIPVKYSLTKRPMRWTKFGTKKTLSMLDKMKKTALKLAEIN